MRPAMTKAIIARYTPIDVEDLREGAFDIDWFKDAFKTIGKQRFEVVYNAAKYISCSNSHTRARKFADATSGTVKGGRCKEGNHCQTEQGFVDELRTESHWDAKQTRNCWNVTNTCKSS